MFFASVRSIAISTRNCNLISMKRGRRGRNPAGLARAFGSRLRAHESAGDAIVATWLESLLADVVFGWRQLLKHKTTSAAAVLSLALGIGSCTAAFRLIDAMLPRPLPVADAGRLYVLSYETSNGSGQTVGRAIPSTILASVNCALH
jgi:hypothetical protein